MNRILFLVVTLASVSVCSVSARAGSRGNWASGATVDRDPANPAFADPASGTLSKAIIRYTPPAPAPGSPQGEEQGARASATGYLPTTTTYSERRGNTKFSVAAANSYNGNAAAAALA